ncbi:MAG TPA: hypothetical protein VK212_06600 [Lentimicrobium sp.]|nr:hypothetical protein [Lentimicrobium sp.]
MKNPSDTDQENDHEIPNDQKRNPAYTRSQKIQDLLIGLGVGFGYIILGSFAAMTLLEFVNDVFFLTIVVLLYALVVYYFFRQKKQYVAIGLILIVVVPPAIVGGCLAIFGT